MVVTNIVSCLARERLGLQQQRRAYLHQLWFKDTPTFTPVDLVSHYECVNALEFSGSGDWLVSGGDDRRILLWNVDEAVDGQGFKAVMEAEHRSNIFCLGLDHGFTRIYSGGNDDQVIVHDIQTKQPLDYFLHEEPVYGLSVQPETSDLFVTACSDGRILLFDMRQPPTAEPLMVTGCSHPFHAVQFNPVEPRLLATANTKQGISLWDIRRPNHALVKYESRSSMSVRFNRAGTKLVGLRRRLPPILFNIESPESVGEFDAPGYYNSCTMKSCTFGGPDDQFIFSGSDNFKVYIWRIPAEDTYRWEDRTLNHAAAVLTGHRSIVNQVRYNPGRGLVATSGVEKVVKVWSNFPTHHSQQEAVRREDEERPLHDPDNYVRLLLRSDAPSESFTSQSTVENPRVMAFFDSLVQGDLEGRLESTDDEDTDPVNTSDSDTDSEGSSDSRDAAEVSSRSRITDLINRKRKRLAKAARNRDRKIQVRRTQEDAGQTQRQADPSASSRSDSSCESRDTSSGEEEGTPTARDRLSGFSSHVNSAPGNSRNLAPNGSNSETHRLETHGGGGSDGETHRLETHGGGGSEGETHRLETNGGSTAERTTSNRVQQEEEGEGMDVSSMLPGVSRPSGSNFIRSLREKRSRIQMGLDED